MDDSDSGRKECRQSDAWLLQAIAMGARKRPSALAEVIGSVDAIEHTIFNYEEIAPGNGFADWLVGHRIADLADVEAVILPALKRSTISARIRCLLRNVTLFFIHIVHSPGHIR